jgi:hypothetical protein
MPSNVSIPISRQIIRTASTEKAVSLSKGNVIHFSGSSSSGCHQVSTLSSAAYYYILDLDDDRINYVISNLYYDHSPFALYEQLSFIYDSCYTSKESTCSAKKDKETNNVEIVFEKEEATETFVLNEGYPINRKHHYSGPGGFNKGNIVYTYEDQTIEWPNNDEFLFKEATLIG